MVSPCVLTQGGVWGRQTEERTHRHRDGRENSLVFCFMETLNLLDECSTLRAYLTLISPALAGMFFITTVPGKHQLLVHVHYICLNSKKKKKKDNNKQRREKFKLRKVRCKIIFIETMSRKSRKGINFKFCDAPC